MEDWSTESSASITECHPGKFFFQSLPLGRVRRFSQSVHQRKETFLLGFFGSKTDLDQIYEHAIGACLPRLGQRAHPPGDTGRNRYALPNRSFCFGHAAYITPLSTRMHHLAHAVGVERDVRLHADECAAPVVADRDFGARLDLEVVEALVLARANGRSCSSTGSADLRAGAATAAASARSPLPP